MKDDTMTLNECKNRCEDLLDQSPRCIAVSFKPDTDLTPRDSDGNPVYVAEERRRLIQEDPAASSEELQSLVEGEEEEELPPEPIITYPSGSTKGECQYFSDCPPVEEEGNSSVASEVKKGTYTYGWCNNDDPDTDIIDIDRQKNEPGDTGWWIEDKLPLCVISVCPVGEFYVWDISTQSDSCGDTKSADAQKFQHGDYLPQASEASEEGKQLPVWFVIFCIGCGIIFLIFCTTAIYSSFHCGHKDRVYRRHASELSMSQRSLAAENADLPIEIQKTALSPHDTYASDIVTPVATELSTKPRADEPEMP